MMPRKSIRITSACPRSWAGRPRIRGGGPDKSAQPAAAGAGRLQPARAGSGHFRGGRAPEIRHGWPRANLNRRKLAQGGTVRRRAARAARTRVQAPEGYNQLLQHRGVRRAVASGAQCAQVAGIMERKDAARPAKAPVSGKYFPRAPPRAPPRIWAPPKY